MPPPLPSLDARFLLRSLGIIALIALITYARLMLRPVLGGQFGIFIFFYSIVAILAWTDGFWTGVIAASVSTLALITFFIGYAAVNMRAQLWDLLVLILFYVTSLMMSWLGETRLRHIKLLESIEKQRDEFVNMAGHELRNPLAILKLNVDLIKKSESIQEQQSILHDIDDEIQYMSNLIGDLLDVARIRQGALVFRDAPCSLDEIVRSVASAQAEVAGVSIDVRGVIDQPINADKEKIQQVVTNILSNALKYSQYERSIIVGMRAHDQMAEISVADRGIGMTQEEINNLAKPYYRAENVVKKYPGLGLGIHLADQVVQHYGGSLGFKSIPDVGTTVTIALPLPQR